MLSHVFASLITMNIQVPLDLLGITLDKHHIMQTGASHKPSRTNPGSVSVEFLYQKPTCQRMVERLCLEASPEKMPKSRSGESFFQSNPVYGTCAKFKYIERLSTSRKMPQTTSQWNIYRAVVHKPKNPSNHLTVEYIWSGCLQVKNSLKPPHGGIYIDPQGRIFRISSSETKRAGLPEDGGKVMP